VDTLSIDAEPPRNFAFVEATQADAPAKVLELVRKIKAEGRFDATWDVQVIVAVNQRSALSREAMSAALQNLLNPDGKQQKGSNFRIGDKVMQTVNGFFRDHTKKGKANEHFVANGDVGKIVSFREKTAVVEFFEPPRIVEMPLSKAAEEGSDSNGGNGDNGGSGGGLVLAYGLTTHKSQGSQFPVVIVCIDAYPGATGAFGICDKHFFYTAFSRAETVCYAVGSKAVLEKCLTRSFINRRKTFLVERLLELNDAFPSDLF
jgi:exodeoxyribonuclease V alpha subunit